MQCTRTYVCVCQPHTIRSCVLPRKCSDHSPALEDGNSLCSDPKGQVDAVVVLSSIQLHTIELQSGWEESDMYIYIVHKQHYQKSHMLSDVIFSGLYVSTQILYGMHHEQSLQEMLIMSE